MTRAFLFLTLRSIRNRLAFQLRRSKNPRYALALIIGLAYFYLMFWRNPRRSTHSVFPLLTAGGHLLVLGGLFLGAVSMWMFGGDSTALAFSQAEASFLFPAPVSRRQLVVYKLVRGQIPLLFNALIWVLLLNAGQASLPVWARFVGVWLLFATIFLHRLGASLVRTAWRESGAQGLKRNTTSLAIFAVILGGVGVSVGRNLPLLRAATDLKAWIAALTAVVTQAPARYVLWPFTALVGPMYAGTLRAWLAVVGPALLVLAIHIWWVLHTDTAFEEAALAATVERARRIDAMRNRRAFGGGNASPGTLRAPRKSTATGGVPLALIPSTHPAAGIVWKNLVCLRRTMQFRQLIPPMVLAVFGGAIIGSDHGGVPGGLAAAAAIFAAAMLILGPMMLRGDLRQDLQHLAELKMLPFTGATIVAAEVLSVSIPLALVQALSLAVAIALAEATHVAWASAAMRVALVVGALPVLLAFNAMSVTIQNGAPILFPGWSRLGTITAGGIEVMGQMILVMGFYFLMLAVLLVIPIAMAFIVVSQLQATGPVGVAAAMLAGSGGLAFEMHGVIQLLGRAFEQLEPSSVSG